MDLALAVDRKEIGLLPIVAAESQRQVQRQSLACISTSDPTFLGRLLTDRHLAAHLDALTGALLDISKGLRLGYFTIDEDD